MQTTGGWKSVIPSVIPTSTTLMDGKIKQIALQCHAKETINANGDDIDVFESVDESEDSDVDAEVKHKATIVGGRLDLTKLHSKLKDAYANDYDHIKIKNREAWDRAHTKRVQTHQVTLTKSAPTTPRSSAHTPDALSPVITPRNKEDAMEVIQQFNSNTAKSNRTLCGWFVALAFVTGVFVWVAGVVIDL